MREYSGGDDPAFERITFGQAIAWVTGLVLLPGPGGLHQAQRGVQCIAAGVIGQTLHQGLAGRQAQAQAGLTSLQRPQKRTAGQQAFRRLFGLVVAFVRGVASSSRASRPG